MKLSLTQFCKFAIVGVINTLVDFTVLNFLIWLFKIYSGWQILFLNSISFACAVINSYFLNRYWTFSEEKEKVFFKFVNFFLISLIGVLINSGIVYLGTIFLNPGFDFSAVIWINIVKFFAVAVSLIWNFIGYKIFVFKNVK